MLVYVPCWFDAPPSWSQWASPQLPQGHPGDTLPGKATLPAAARHSVVLLNTSHSFAVVPSAENKLAVIWCELLWSPIWCYVRISTLDIICIIRVNQVSGPNTSKKTIVPNEMLINTSNFLRRQKNSNNNHHTKTCHCSIVHFLPMTAVVV